MRKLSWALRLAACLLISQAGPAWAGVSYKDPTGGWTYLFGGDKDATDDFGALDGSWSHDNGSDAFDGSKIGEDGTAPGGIAVITEGSTTFLRVEDTGDPRNQGFTDPSNRKIYFTRDISEFDPDGEILTAGVTLTFRTRLATTGLLDRQVPSVGDGYNIQDNGKSTFGIFQQSGGIISFALSTNGSDDRALNPTGALLMNKYVESGDNTQVDSADSGEHREFPVASTADWNEFWITIQGRADEVNQYDVNVYANGSTTPTKLVVTSGAGSEFAASYLGFGQHSTGQLGAVDMDFYGFKPGVLVPQANGPVGPVGDFNGDGQLGVADIDQLTSAVRGNSTEAKYDVNQDKAVNGEDRLYWVNQLKKTYLGDADLNGEFNSGDFIVVFQAGQYEDGTPGNSTWATGDWSGDGDFDTSDFVVAFQAGGYEKGPRTAVSAVPEPTAGASALIALLLAPRFRRRRA